MSTTQTYYGPRNRFRYFRDDEGVLSATKREDEIIQLVLDWSRDLATGETIASVAYDSSGVTLSGTSSTATTSTCTVTGVGETEITATLSTGRKLQRVVRWYAENGAPAEDYA